jgi:hypothetical protein
VLNVLLKDSGLNQELGQTCADTVEQDLQIGLGGRVDSSEHLFLVIKSSAIGPIQEADVKVSIQI